VDIQLITLPSIRVASLRHIGPYGANLGVFWREFHSKCAINGLSGNMFGVGHDDPSVTSSEKCRYDACVEVAVNADVPTPFCVSTLPGGRYATLEYDGDATHIGGAWIALCDQWLPASGFRCGARPMFEWYRATDRTDEQKKTFTCLLCLPVATPD
jgi:AraC family transcriptional regulator